MFFPDQAEVAEPASLRLLAPMLYNISLPLIILQPNLLAVSTGDCALMGGKSVALLDTQVTGVRHAAWKQHCASHTVLCAAALRQAMSSGDGGDGLAVDRQGHSDGVDGSEEQPRREGKGGNLKKRRASRAVDCEPEVRLELLLHRLLVCTMSGCCVGTIPFGNVPPMLQCRVDGELKETSDGQRRKAVKADKRKKTAGNVAEVRPHGG